MTKLFRHLLRLLALVELRCLLVKGSCLTTKVSLSVVGVFDSFDTASVTSFERAIERHNSNQQRDCTVNLTHKTLYVSESMSVLNIVENAKDVLSDGSCFMIHAAWDFKGKILLDMGVRLGLALVSAVREFYYIPGSERIYFNYDPISVIGMNKIKGTETRIAALLAVLQELTWRRFVLITDNDSESLRFVSLLEQTLVVSNLEIIDWFLFTRDAIVEMISIRFQNLSSDATTFLAITNNNTLLTQLFFGARGLGSWIILSDLNVMQFSHFNFPDYAFLMTPRINHELTTHSFVDDAVQSISLALTERPSTSSNGGCPNTNDLRSWLSTVKFHGKTGPVKFDALGNRLPHCYDVHRMLYMETADPPVEAEPVGYWCDGKLHITKRDDTKIIRILLNEYPPNVLSQPKIAGETCQSNSIPCKKSMAHGKEIELCCYGFAIDVIQQVANVYPFTPELLFSLDGQYGVYDEANDSWNGVVAELLSDRGDASFDLYISSRRANVVDFTGPYMPSGIRLLVKEKKRQDSQIYWLSYLRPFTPPVWLTLIGSLGVMIYYLWIMDKLSPIRKSSHSAATFGFGNAICFALSLAFGRPADESKPTTNGARLSSVAFGIAMLVFISTYSANLAAFLIVDDKTTPVQDIYDPKIDRPPKGFKYGTVAGSYMADYFKNSKNAYFRHIWYHMKKNNVKSLSEGVRALRSGELDVFIADDVGLEYESINDPYCELKVIGEPFAMSGASLAVKKGNPLFAPLSGAIRQIQAQGLTDYIQRFWVKKFSCNREIPPAQLRVEDLSGLFLQLMIAVVACVLGTICQRMLLSFKQQCQMKKKNNFDKRDQRHGFSYIETFV